MGKKRQRVLIDQDNIEFDPNFFDRDSHNALDDKPSLRESSSSTGKDIDNSPAIVESPSNSTKDDVDCSKTRLAEQSQDLLQAGSLLLQQLQSPEEEKTANVSEQGPHKKARRESASEDDRKEDGLPPMDTVAVKPTEQNALTLPSDPPQEAEPGPTSDPDIIVIESSDSVVDLCDDSDDEFAVTQLVEHQPSTDSTSRSVTPVTTSETAVNTSPQEAGDSSRRARKEESLRTVSVHVESLVPGSERNFDTQWRWNQSLADLQDQFGPETVLVYEGSKKPWFYSPKRIAKDSSQSDSQLAIQIFAVKQWENMIRKAELGEFALPSDPPSEGIVPPVAQDESSGFIVVIRSKKDEVKVMVTQNTTVHRLIEHFRGVTNTSPTQNIRFVFDGDYLDPNSTMAELEIEEDDGLDAHID